MRLFLYSILALLPCITKAGTDPETLGQLEILLPSGWSVIQRASSGGIDLLLLGKNQDTVSFFKRPSKNETVQSFVSPDSKLENQPTKIKTGGLTWERLTTSRKPKNKDTVFVNHFLIATRGTLYHGFSRSKTAALAEQNADEILQDTILVAQKMGALSLTAPSYTGKKYYLGWGAAEPSDKAFMHNEVKYDVLHTHDVFTANFGGNYLPEKLIGPQSATATAIRKAWNDIGAKIKSEDMFLQYSSGHGFTGGLGVGVSYKEMRDTVLGYPAKETVVLTMACHSGGLVDAFNAAKSKWEDYPKSGRSLFVLASSETHDTSSTGPGKDPDQSGPSGSAGSAFGHAVWKSISGKSDGFVDGILDGFVSFEELRDYTVARTIEIGGHRPVFTGTYHPKVILNQIPSASTLAALTGGTESLSDAQIENAISELEASHGVHSEQR